MLAHVNIIPEMNHNEIVGLGRPVALNKKIVRSFLHNPQAHPRNKIRTNVVKEITKDGQLALDMENEIHRDTLLTRDGEVIHARVLELLGLTPDAPAEERKE